MSDHATLQLALEPCKAPTSNAPAVTIDEFVGVPSVNNIDNVLVLSKSTLHLNLFPHHGIRLPSFKSDTHV